MAGGWRSFLILAGGPARKEFYCERKFEGETEKDLYGKNMDVPFKAVNKKPILPIAEEISRNPRARSAKLRIIERI